MPSYSSKKTRSAKPEKSRHSRTQPDYLSAFDPDLVNAGYHIFADGASVPNPGAGGWGVVVYRDGEEIHSECGGDLSTTNNAMEITAVLNAIRWALHYPALAVTIWSDSQYVVNGVNNWRHGWKAKGWKRGGPNSEPKNRTLLNSDLWQEIDEALCDSRAANIQVNWIKGHAGHVGNERADELADQGRQNLLDENAPYDLDREYRAIMQEAV